MFAALSAVTSISFGVLFALICDGVLCVAGCC